MTYSQPRWKGSGGEGAAAMMQQSGLLLMMQQSELLLTPKCVSCMGYGVYDPFPAQLKGIRGRGSWGGCGTMLLEEAEPLGAHEGADELPASTWQVHFQLHPFNSSFSFTPVSHRGVNTWGFLPNYSSLLMGQESGELLHTYLRWREHSASREIYAHDLLAVRWQSSPCCATSHMHIHGSFVQARNDWIRDGLKDIDHAVEIHSNSS